MILAGLDTGTTSGLGLIRGDRLIHAESRHFDGEDPEAFFKYSRWLDEVFQRFDIAELAFESPLRTNSTVKTEEIVDDELVKTERPIGNMRTFLRLYGIRGCTLLALQRHRSVVQRRAAISTSARSTFEPGARGSLERSARRTRPSIVRPGGRNKRSAAAKSCSGPSRRRTLPKAR